MDLYRDLLDSLGVAVWESDPDARRFVGLDAIQKPPEGEFSDFLKKLGEKK